MPDLFKMASTTFCASEGGGGGGLQPWLVFLAKTEKLKLGSGYAGQKL